VCTFLVVVVPVCVDCVLIVFWLFEAGSIVVCTFLVDVDCVLIVFWLFDAGSIVVCTFLVDVDCVLIVFWLFEAGGGFVWRRYVRTMTVNPEITMIYL